MYLIIMSKRYHVKLDLEIIADSQDEADDYIEDRLSDMFIYGLGELEMYNMNYYEENHEQPARLFDWEYLEE